MGVGLPAQTLRSPIFFSDLPASSTQIQRLQRKIGIQKLKQGTHTQQWRLEGLEGTRQAMVGAFAKLGPAGGTGPDYVMKIDFTYSIFNYYRSAGGTLLIQDFVVEFSKAIHHVMSELHQKIEIYVPLGDDIPSKGHSGGTLRRTLHNSVNAAYSTSFPMSVQLDASSLDYSGPANQMPTRSLQRSGRAPGARRWWYNLLLLHGRNEAKKAILNVMKKLGSQIDPQVLSNLGLRSGYNLMQKLVRYEV